MKTRIRELAKPGIYGSEDNPQVVTAADLKQIAETFASVKKAPIQFGHWGNPENPRLGNCVAVVWDETTQTLSGTFEEHDTLAQAVDDGFYPDLSIKSQRRARDGKMYLVHVAYLGEEAPAIKDLVAGVSASLEAPGPDEIAASEAKGGVIIPPVGSRLFSMSDLITLSDLGKKPPQKKHKEENLKTAEELQKELETEQAKTLVLSDQVKAMEGTLAALTTKYPEEELLLSENADPRVTGMYAQLRKGKEDGLVAAAAGKVPKAKMPLVRTLAGTLSASQSIELSEGDKKEKLDGFTLLGRIFEAIPTPVKPGALSLSDGEEMPAAPISAKEMLKSF